jgi:sugar lactone lactonase YvrE
MALLLLACGGGGGKGSVERLYGAQDNQLDVYDLDSGEVTVLIPSERNNVNGQVCLLPDGSGNFLMGEDTEQSEGARQGWGIFSPDGELVGKILEAQNENEATQIEPFGCAFDLEKRLFVTDVGSGSFSAQDGKLIVYFPPDYDTFCVLDGTLLVPGTVAVDGDGSIYVPETVPPGHVLRFDPPFPADDQSCDSTALNRSTFIEDEGMTTPFGIARAPNRNWYVSSVLLPTEIREYTSDGEFVRSVIEGDDIGNPAGIAVASDGTLYYADLGLVEQPPPQFFGPGDHTGSVRRVRFDEDGNALPPEIMGSGLNYPDAVSVIEVSE